MADAGLSMPTSVSFGFVCACRLPAAATARKINEIVRKNLCNEFEPCMLCPPFIVNMTTSIVAALFSNIVWSGGGIEVSVKHAAAELNPTAVQSPEIREMPQAAGNAERCPI